MVQQITKGIKVSVETNFEGTFYRNHKMHHAFAYTVHIENQSDNEVQLMLRHWSILDALNNVDIVDGEGVIGEKPVLSPGGRHTYSSGCYLVAPIGAMSGHYGMLNLDTNIPFEVGIPSFKLNAPFVLN